MPLNEIEKHPFLDYFIKASKSEANVNWGKYTRLILGSFPVYEITDTDYPEEKRNKRSRNPPDGYLPFFYGSKTNMFWEYLFGAFDGFESNVNFVRPEKEKLIEFCESKGVLVSDVIKSTNRFMVTKNQRGKSDVGGTSSADSALLNSKADESICSRFEFNLDLLKWLERLDKLKSIYFTAQGTQSKTPYGWFVKALEAKKAVCTIASGESSPTILSIKKPFERKFELFFLPTPSSFRSLHMTKDNKHEELYKYIRKNYAEFLQIIEKNNFKMDNEQKDKLRGIRKKYLQQCWIERVRNQNCHFLDSQ